MKRSLLGEYTMKCIKKTPSMILKYILVMIVTGTVTSCLKSAQSTSDSEESESGVGSVSFASIRSDSERKKIISSCIFVHDKALNERFWSAMLDLDLPTQDAYIRDLLGHDKFADESILIVSSFVDLLAVRVKKADNLLAHYLSHPNGEERIKKDYRSVRNILRLCCMFNASLGAEFECQIHDLLRKASLLPSNVYLLDGFISPSLSFLNLKHVRIDKRILVRLGQKYSASRGDWRIDGVMRDAEFLQGLDSPKQVPFREPTLQRGRDISTNTLPQFMEI